MRIYGQKAAGGGRLAPGQRRRQRQRWLSGSVLGLAVLGVAGCAANTADTTPSDVGSGKAVARLMSESYAVQGLGPSRWAAQLSAATAQLPKVAARRIYRSADGTRYYTASALTVFPATARANLTPETVDEEAYYYGPLGSPLFYMRLLDIVSENLRANLQGRRLLEWNYSSIGPLKLLALQGVQAVGVSASPRLRALYSLPGDQGDVAMADRAVSGRLTLVAGAFPRDPAARAAVGGDYDVVIARNLLTRGYIHPSSSGDAAPPDATTPRPAALINLGMSDEEFLRSMLAVLKPGGRLLIYNLCQGPPPADQPYDPHSDCRNPFPQSLWQGVGYRVRDYDRSDTPAARALAKAVAAGPLTTPTTLLTPAGTAQLAPDAFFATYTLVERP